MVACHIVQPKEALHYANDRGWHEGVSGIGVEGLSTCCSVVIDGNVEDTLCLTDGSFEDDQHAMTEGLGDRKAGGVHVLQDGIMCDHARRKGALDLGSREIVMIVHRFRSSDVLQVAVERISITQAQAYS